MRTVLLIFVLATIFMILGLFRLFTADEDATTPRFVIDKLMVLASLVLYIAGFIITET